MLACLLVELELEFVSDVLMEFDAAVGGVINLVDLRVAASFDLLLEFAVSFHWIKCNLY